MRISDWIADVCSTDLVSFDVQIAVLTFDGFNELDSFVAAAILNRLRGQGWEAHITAPTPRVTSMNGVTIERQQPLDFAAKADAVIIGSGVKTREIAADPLMLGRIRLDPARQLIGAQCSGTLLLATLGGRQCTRRNSST